MTRIFFLLLALLGFFANTGCELPTEGAPDAQVPMYNKCADQEQRALIAADYELEMTQNQLLPPLSDKGRKWVMGMRNTYEAAFIFARCRDTEANVPVLVNYYGGIGARTDFFKEAWTLEREEEFRQLMQSLMREVFPGYNFVLTFNHDEESWISSEEAAIVIHLAYDEDRYSFATGKEVYLIHPTIIGHEAGHLCPSSEKANGFCMGFSHHYLGDEYLDRSHGPPEEDEGTCVMFRNGAIYGRTERDAALLNYEPGTEERILGLASQIRAMLPDEMNAREEANECAMATYNPVLTDH